MRIFAQSLRDLIHSLYVVFSVVILIALCVFLHFLNRGCVNPNRFFCVYHLKLLTLTYSIPSIEHYHELIVPVCQWPFPVAMILCSTEVNHTFGTLTLCFETPCTLYGNSTIDFAELKVFFAFRSFSSAKSNN